LRKPPLDYKGKEADRLVTRIDPGVVSPVAELRARERRPRSWASGRPGVDQPKALDASPAAVTLALEKRALELYPYLSRRGNALT
jgi:hypothetical protein